ncbi:heme ABC transporter ATP-binding protein, partial [Campylobacter jejuni]|nr:heme ABC transporter ATP-binding protein [Campylobacter jejuni]
TLQQKTKATVIIVEHRVEEVLTCPLDRIVVLDDGQIIADATPDALLRQDILHQAGIRPPLYLEALRQAKISLEQLPDVTSVAKLPTDPTIAQALAKLQQVQPATSSKNTTQLELHDVSFSYTPDQKYPLTDIDLTVNAGEFISIAG